MKTAIILIILFLGFFVWAVTTLQIDCNKKGGELVQYTCFDKSIIK